MSKLTPSQVAEIEALLSAGETLPDDYRHLLFPPDKREYELVYWGKEREEDILSQTWAVPLQAVKTFNLPKGTRTPEWTNRLIFGDNLQVMKRLLEDPEIKGQVKLVYIDPPFATKQEFQGHKEEKAYQDKIVGAKFIEFLRKRFVLIRELLADDGFLMLHMDYRYGHYAKVLLDELFPAGFRNEIKVPRGTKNVQNQFEEITSLTIGDDSLFLYAKSSRAKLPHLRVELDEHAVGKWDTFWRGTDRPTMRYSLFGQRPGTGQWRWRESRALKAIKNYETYLNRYAEKESLDEYYAREFEDGNKIGFVRLNEKKVVQYYVPPRDSRIASTLWINIRTLGRVTTYPTEKHEELLHRVVNWLSSPGDIVLDCFAGSGTSCAVAEKLGRRWIGIDCGKLAIYTIQKRMLNLREEIGNRGKPLRAKPFTLYNGGLYDFARMRDLPWQDYRLFALQLFQIRDEPHRLGGIRLDGYKGGSDALVFNFKAGEGVVLDEKFVEDLHKHIGDKTRAEFFIVAPAASVTFLEDYFEFGDTRYYVLRIPYSIIDELHERPFREIRQPVDESEVNSTVDAVGFDFVQPPLVEASYFGLQHENGSPLHAIIKVRKFESEVITRRPREFKNRETLSMVMVDYDYQGNGEGHFDLDAVFYRDQLEKDRWEVRLDGRRLGARVMIIYMDIFGNEMREVKTPMDFGVSQRK